MSKTKKTKIRDIKVSDIIILTETRFKVYEK